MELSQRYLGSPQRGLEIGASANNPFSGLNKWNLDHPHLELFQAAQKHVAGAAAPIDLGGSAEHLPIADGALDYVLASHVVEHMPDTIRALREWDRVVRPGGHIFLIVPHKERTFDKPRPRTPLEHHLADHALGMTVAASPMAPTSHYHVWITEDFVSLLRYLMDVGWLDWQLVEVEDVDSKVGNGFTVVARKLADPPSDVLPAPGADVAFFHCTLMLPFQVPGRTVEHTLSCSELPAQLPLPRGRYSIVPVRGVFPPVADVSREVLVGETLGSPVIEALWLEDSVLRVRGAGFCSTTYLEALLPGGSTFSMLPMLVDEELRMDLSGHVIPEGSILVRAVNLPPGGGTSEPQRLMARS